MVRLTKGAEMSLAERSPRSRRRVLLALAAAATLVLATCEPLGQGGATGGAGSPGAASSPGGSPGGAGTNRLTIATGGTGGVYFPLGGRLAQELTENIAGVSATAQETSASVDNMRLIGS